MLYLSCASLICPVGYSAASAAAAMRAGIAAFSETGYRDVNREPIVGATVEALPPELRGRDRLIALGQLALDSIDPGLAERLPWGRMPLILCSRESERPGARLTGLVAKLRFPGEVNFAGQRTAHAAGGAASAIQ